MIEVEVSNRSGRQVDESGAVALARDVLAAEGVAAGELGLAFVGVDEMRGLKDAHLGLAEPTDVLSFPIDGCEPLPQGVPRALGDVVLCPDIIGDAWQWPLVHGVLHLLGHEHGPAMEARERALLP